MLKTAAPALSSNAVETLASALEEATGDVVVLVDENDLITRWSGVAERLFEKAATECIGRKASEVLPLCASSVFEVLRRGEPWALGADLSRSPPRFSWSAQGFHGQTGFAGAIYRARRQFLDGESQATGETTDLVTRAISAVFDHAQEGFVVVDRHGRVVVMNQKAKEGSARAIGRELVRGEDVLLASAPGTELAFLERLRRAFLGIPTLVEKELRFPNGQWMDMRLEYRPLFEDGEVFAVLFGSYAAPDRIDRERAVLLERALFQTPMTFLIADARKPDCPLVFASGALEKLTGYEPAEVLGRNARLFHGPDGDEVALATVRKSITSGTSCDVVLKNRHKDGSSYWTRLVLAPVRDDDGAVSHFLGVQWHASALLDATVQLFSDVTEATVQTEVLDGLVHDMRNGLMALTGQVEELSEDRAVDDPVLGATHATIKQIAGIVSLLRSPVGARTSRGHGVLLKEALTSMAIVARHLLPKSVVVDVFHGIEGSAVDVDGEVLGRVLLNALLNARDALTGQEGRVTLRVVPGRFSETANTYDEGAPFHTVEVEDTGKGMAPEVLARAFEPRFTTKPDAPGAGLGLPTSLANVKAFGGEISIGSVPGAGTTVRITLPAMSSNRSKLPASALRVVHGLEVLMVEPDTRVRAVVASMLARRGVKLHSVGDLPAGRRVAPSMGATSVLVLNASPVVPGAEDFLAEWLASTPERSAIVIAGPTVERANRTERVACLTLPFDNDDLIVALAALGRVGAP